MIMDAIQRAITAPIMAWFNFVDWYNRKRREADKYRTSTYD